MEHRTLCACENWNIYYFIIWFVQKIIHIRMNEIVNSNVKAMYKVWNDSTSNYAAKKTPLEVKRFEKLVADLFSVGPYY